MSSTTVNVIKVFAGTDRTEITTTNLPVGSTYYQSSGGIIKKYVWTGASWNLENSDGTVAIAAGTALIGKVGIDQTTDCTTNKVQARNVTHGDFQVNATMQLADADISITNPVPAHSDVKRPSASITRPDNATPYLAGDVIAPANNAVITFANVLSVAGAGFRILAATMRIDIAAVISGMTNFTLHLYNASPTELADNAPWVLADADRDKYFGDITLNILSDKGGTLFARTDEINLSDKLADGSTSLYAQLSTDGAHTPSALYLVTLGLVVMRL